MMNELQSLLDLEPLGEDLFRAHNLGAVGLRRIFGGQVAAQALRAAALTIEADHHPHSLHCYFVREGKPDTPLALRVYRIRDGRSFTTRSVVAMQDDQAIFSLSASFQRHEEGLEYQVPMSEGVPGPESSTPLDRISNRFPLDVRQPAPSPDESHPPPFRIWVRTREELPDDPLVHECALTFLSDLGSPFGYLVERSAKEGKQFFAASLDHAVWFHRPIRADDWLLLDLRPRSAAGARTLYYGTVHTRGGLLGASTAQEGVLRIRRAE